jgi:aspartyl-tRNA(Asn)/glutamyl-tRNA(Gln) amidotransferase subunit B
MKAGSVLAVSDVMIGLEVHVQLATCSKLFCGCPTNAEEPNTACCPTCLGMPGSKPVLNEKALEYALKVAAALECEINKSFFFSRKTYFYPDMAKNFQTTQYEIPLGIKGRVGLSSGKALPITRVHLEEDPAALVHSKGIKESSHVLVDYNRSGIPLVEIVTEPAMSSPAEARDFLDQLTTILSYLKVYIPETCTLKADCNVSIRGGERSEIKNVSGKRNVEKALAFEISRHRNLIANKERAVRETRAFDEKTQRTMLLRAKETEADYGYIFDPDLPSFSLDEGALESLRKSLPELHAARALRFAKEFCLDEYTSKVLASDFELSNLFQELASSVEPLLAARFLTREVLAVLNRNNLELHALKLDFAEISHLLKFLQEGRITEKNAKETIIAYLTKGIAPSEFIKKNQLLKDMPLESIEAIAERAISQNKAAVQDYLSGKGKALNFLVGLIMKETKGKAEPRELRKLIEKKLGERVDKGI